MKAPTLSSHLFRGVSRALMGCLLGGLVPTFAHAFTPIRDPRGLNSPRTETVARVATARVIVADYGLIRRDFPSQATRSDSEIDQWLLDHTAFVSEPQAAQTEVNSSIHTTGQTATAFRPDEYKRALVFKVEGEGLIDAKGTGALYPRPGDHSDGLGTTGEMIREYLYEKMVHAALLDAKSPVETVGSYAVVDLGFDVKHLDGSYSPAGMVLRQAHERSLGDSSVLDDKTAFEVELTLRRYGITSAGAYRDQPVERVNIQGTRGKNAVIDFGGYLVVEKFTKPAINFFTQTILFTPGSPEFIQPDPTDRIPFKVWGDTVSGKADPKFDNPWIWSHQLAKNLRDGTAQRSAVDLHVRNLLGPAISALENHGFSGMAANCPGALAAVFR